MSQSTQPPLTFLVHQRQRKTFIHCAKLSGRLFQKKGTKRDCARSTCCQSHDNVLAPHCLKKRKDKAKQVWSSIVNFLPSHPNTLGLELVPVKMIGCRGTKPHLHDRRESYRQSPLDLFIYLNYIFFWSSERTNLFIIWIFGWTKMEKHNTKFFFL